MPAGTTFVVRSGDIPIAHSVDRGDQVLVTAEPSGRLADADEPADDRRPARLKAAFTLSAFIER